MHRILPAVLLLAAVMFCPAQEISAGFRHFYNLEYDQALEYFEERIEAEPENPRVYNHAAQALLYKILFRAGALETQLVSGNNPFLRRSKAEASSEEKQQFFRYIDKALELTGNPLENKNAGVEQLFDAGVAHGLRANWFFLVEKSWKSSLGDATDARKLHDRVAELQPELIDAQMVQGVHDYVVGSLPWYYKMLGFLVGYRGDKDRGIRTLERVAAEGERNVYDAKVLLCAVYRREGGELMDRSVPLLKELIGTFPRNHLLRLELAQMYSDLGNGDEAIAVLEEIETLREEDDAMFSSLQNEKLFYAKGNVQFWYRNYDAALENMTRAVEGAGDMDMNTGVLAWMRLGQIQDMLGNREAAQQAYREAIRYAPDSDAAKESRGYLRKPYRRDG
jgi:tetratricopeptide (TPR) repeat protein